VSGGVRGGRAGGDGLAACGHAGSAALAAAEGADLDHPGLGRPEEGVQIARGSGTGAHGVATVVDGGRPACAPPEGAEIDHPGLGRPEESVDGAPEGSDGAAANDVTAVIDGAGFGKTGRADLPEDAEIDHPDLGRPEKSASIALAHDFAAIVHALRNGA